MNMSQAHPDPSLDPTRGAAVYSQLVLGLYDPMIIGLSNSYLWKCPSEILLAHYNRHVSGQHLDVGVGTGYFLDHCRFPTASPRVELLDLNPESLRYTKERIARYRPVAHQANILEPLPPLAPFQSIGINYVLHCLPGDMASKARVFANLKPLLAADGVLFGSTILGEGVPRSWLARQVMRRYNRRGIFTNTTDSAAGLRAALSGLRDIELTVQGCVAMFSARA